MIIINLAPLKQEPLEAQVERVTKHLASYFASSTMTVAQYLVLEVLPELIKNSLDAKADQLFIEDKETDHTLIGIFDNGDGFTDEFLGKNLRLNYGEKLSGQSFIISDKKGQDKLGGAGRGLAEAYEVINDYQGTIVCSNRDDGQHGARIEFFSPIQSVSKEAILDKRNEKKQKFSSPFQNYTAEESELKVALILQEIGVLSKKRASTVLAQKTADEPIADGLSQVDKSYCSNPL